ncbi:MAG: CHAT domain-containing protein [Methylocystaceae bacterium]|nr:CHAT domain-containing protein [Methylocystaceae bacterium]
MCLLKKHKLNIKIYFISLIFLQGCQTPQLETVSIEKAKQYTHDIEKKDYTAPPSSIDDIVVSLGRIKRNQGSVSFSPPDQSEVQDDAEYFFKRGKWFWKIGDWASALNDLRRAYSLLRNAEGRVELKNDVNIELSRMEINAGNYGRGIDLIMSSNGDEKSINIAMLQGLVKSGDLDAAWEKTEEALRLLNQLKKALPEIAEWENLWSADIDGIFATILEIRGVYQEAEAYRRRALKKIEKEKASSQKVSKYLNESKITFYTSLSYNLLRQDRLTEAEFIARLALKGGINSSDIGTDILLSPLNVLEKVMAAKGRFNDAIRLLNVRRELLESKKIAQRSVPLALTYKRKGELYVSEYRWSEAHKAFEVAASVLSKNSDLQRIFLEGNLSWALSKIEAGSPSIGRKIANNYINKALALYGPNTYEIAEAKAVLAMSEKENGNNEAALKLFRELYPVFQNERRMNLVAQGAESTRRFNLFTSTYLELLSNDFRNNRTSLTEKKKIMRESLIIAETAREASVLTTISASVARSKTLDPSIQKLVRREQDTRRQISAIYELLSNVSQGDRKFDKNVKRLEQEVEKLQIAQRSLENEIFDQFPEYSNFLKPNPNNVLSIKKHLADDELAVSIFQTKNSTFVWGIDSSGGISLHIADLGKDELKRRVKKIRSPFDLNINSLGGLLDFDLTESYFIYKQLLAPVLKKHTNMRSIIVVANGVLNELPFSLLAMTDKTIDRDEKILFDRYRHVDWLIKSYAISKIPSISALIALRSKKLIYKKKLKPFIGFGDPFFNSAQMKEAQKQYAKKGVIKEAFGLRSIPKLNEKMLPTIGELSRLPDTSIELVSIANSLKLSLDKTVYLGKRASEANVKALDLSSYRIISFATHGLNAGTMNGLYYPALALSAPEVTNTDDDGFLTSEEVLGMNLNADMIILSACNTATGTHNDAEFFSGLARSFFFAGAKSLVVSNWAVHSGATKQLMISASNYFIQNDYRGKSEAFKHAISDMINSGVYIKDGKEIYSYAHPLFWASFTLIGDSG